MFVFFILVVYLIWCCELHAILFSHFLQLYYVLSVLSPVQGRTREEGKEINSVCNTATMRVCCMSRPPCNYAFASLPLLFIEGRGCNRLLHCSEITQCWWRNMRRGGEVWGAGGAGEGGGVDFGVINSVEVVCRDTWLRPGEGGGAKADDVTVPKKLEPG